ncbi:hypothetical protein QE109_02165 [Fusibacter bizertensis]|uniref:Uncharacterized protein n=1 Tax=Fusibacter bizertensis TaxID=1488331 RepID=A0ABT6N939_9FIRM|nr:hypothetical protein [Fusibacter bizertensis]MDH8676931.1 hypothetical protein [Fusibacter bizertensis]
MLCENPSEKAWEDIMINYAYIEGTIAGDGKEIDVYVPGRI